MCLGQLLEVSEALAAFLPRRIVVAEDTEALSLVEIADLFDGLVSVEPNIADTVDLDLVAEGQLPSDEVRRLVLEGYLQALRYGSSRLGFRKA